MLEALLNEAHAYLLDEARHLLLFGGGQVLERCHGCACCVWAPVGFQKCARVPVEVGEAVGRGRRPRRRRRQHSEAPPVSRLAGLHLALVLSPTQS